MMRWVLLATFLLSGPSVFAQATDEVDRMLADLDAKWLSSWQGQIDSQVELLAAAYDLNVDMQEAVRKELKERLVEQDSFEQQHFPELSKMAEGMLAAGDGSPEAQAVVEKLAEIGRTMPMNERIVAGWLEEQLPPEACKGGRQRLEELWHRRAQRRVVYDQDLERLAGKKKGIQKGRRTRQAQVSSRAKPMPHGRKAGPTVRKDRHDFGKRIIRPNRGIGSRLESPKEKAKRGAVIEAAKRPSKPSVRKQGSDSSRAPKRQDKRKAGRAGYATAPPLDEWDKYVAQIAEKYRFTNAQLTKAQSILRDLRHRAYQYQMSRSADFARAELMVDKKARKEELDRLNRPLDALFDELKLRLENLPTLAQKQQAKVPAKKRK